MRLQRRRLGVNLLTAEAYPCCVVAEGLPHSPRNKASATTTALIVAESITHVSVHIRHRYCWENSVIQRSFPKNRLS